MPYDETYFRGDFVPNPDPSGYSEYSDHTYTDEGSAIVASKFIQHAQAKGINLSGRKVLVVGCAYGWIVKYLIDQGVSAWGMDISPFAISQAPPEIASRVMVGDVRLTADWDRAKTMAGLTKNQKFDAVFDEDMLCCLTDAEAKTFCQTARSYSNLLIHLITDSAHLAAWYTYHTIAQWKAWADAQNRDQWYARFTWSEV